MVVAEISVRGILQSRGALVAMITGPDGKTYIVHQGDKLMDGTIKSITPQGLVVTCHLVPQFGGVVWLAGILLVRAVRHPRAHLPDGLGRASRGSRPATARRARPRRRPPR